MIGVKSIAIVGLAGTAAAVTIARGTLGFDHLAEITVASAFAIGLFASLGAALVGVGARPGETSRAGLALRAGRPVFAVDLPRAHPDIRELPSVVQRTLLVGAFACVGLGTFTSDATARIASVPADLTAPSRAAYCLPEAEPDATAPAPVAPPPPAVDQAGCALVKRAFALGYAKTLGSCAPRAAPIAPVVATVAPRERCDRRELDEPFLHYTWRRVVDTVRGASPVDAASSRVDEFRTRVGFLDDLLADIKHSITGTPHASHHLWITLPDPHPRAAGAQLFRGEVPCANTFADLPLWPSWTTASPPAAIVEHVLGQLLFATRFGTPASCTDYTLHWDAPPEACTRLAADPTGFLDAADALEPIRAVLDRRRRQLAMRRLATALGHGSTLPEPPPARSVVSVACFVVGGAPGIAGRDLVLDGETITLREAHTAAVVGTGAGPLDVYVALARLLAGANAAVGSATTAATDTTAGPPGPLAASGFSLTQLEPLVEASPFAAGSPARALLERADVVEVFPFDLHVHAFVDAFRRVYAAQRGRL